MISVFAASRPGSAAAGLAGETPDRAGDPVDSASRRCESCHALEQTFSHPVNVPVSRALPSGFPLANGRLTCTTCHVAVEHDRAGAGPMLRVGTGLGSMCAECHDRSQGRTKQVHASGFGQAHLKSGNFRSSNKGRSGVGQLDEESRGCMGCHDGSMAGDAGAHATARSGTFGQAQDHPIGVVYRGGMVKGRSEDYHLVEPSRLDPRVRLFNQSVGCGSCHSVYSKQDHLLVMSNQRSKLCLSCHAQ